MKIPEDYRDRLYTALLGAIDRIPEGDEARLILEEVAARDLDSIEPIIEELLDRMCGRIN